ncbi:MAG: endolytic transglycosylase MltG [Oscillospiraceae bacterium]|nr:endolytic transglycosylase MltG [Oscillospiraceae bacterium]
MDKKEYPELEETTVLPEEQPAPPVEPVEDMPVIEELTFSAEPHVELPSVPNEIEPDETPIPEAMPELESAPAAKEIPGDPQPAPSAEPAVLPMPEEVSAEASQSAPAEVVAPIEILPDTQAMDAHGMLDHGEEEPPFDMSILDDPELAIPEEPPVEEIQDQEYRDNGKEFDAMFHAPAPKQKEPEPPRQAPKGRPKRKKGEGLLGIPNILVTIVWLALIVAIGVTAGRMLWICAADVLAFGREDKPVTITIYEADTMDDIINKLQENGLIRYKSLFKFYADISDAEEDIKPGIYDLNTRYDYHALVNFMSPRSSREVITLTIPEGYTSAQIFRLLEENRICTAQDIAAYAANGELDPYWFLEGIQRGSENCLEGYLFPDTYEFYKNSTPREALQRMLNNFDYRFDADMRARIDALNAELTGNYTIREIAIVASLIEKESAAPAESPKIAGVIYNRLFNWGNNPPYLNIDASIVYAQGGDTEHIDTKLDSPYNTYTNTGLTPGPIANPGLASLKAALNPESHNYYYYVLNPATGMHQFSTTYDEHTGYVRSFAEAQ